MYPKHHILLGILFVSVLYSIFHLSIGILVIIFLSSILIDIDHYIVYAIKKRDFSYKRAYDWHEKEEAKARLMAKKGIRKKASFHTLHTIEFHAVFLILSFANAFFFYVFIGFMFHSIVDFIDLALTKTLYRREYFLTRWLAKR